MAFNAQALFISPNTPDNTNKTSRIQNKDRLFALTSTNLTPKKWSISPDNILLSSPLDYKNQYTESPSHLVDDLSIEHSLEVKQLKRLMMKIGEEDPYESLDMIDAVQRLCIDYHFQDEIEAILHRHYAISSSPNHRDSKLHNVALRFRLLRQRGYYVPIDVFGDFVDKEGKFDKELTKDIKGMMSLYEASQLSIHGEDVLDEAEKFSTQILSSSTTDEDKAKLVGNTLAHPHHKSLANFLVMNYFGEYQGTNIRPWTSVLLQFAKVDFNIVQTLHQEELARVLQWWKKTGLAQELKFARDQPLKLYICSLACATDPRFSEQRVEATKFISFIYLIDDIFDVYGTLHQLSLFTEAVNRWDVEATKELPDCMRICFEALYKLTNEASHKIYQKNGFNPINSFRKVWSNLCKAFLVEAKWFAAGEIPSVEEYLKNGIVSTGVHVVLVHLFFLLGQGLTKENIELLDRMPPIVSSVATVLRLWDDLGSAKDENQEGFDGSYMKCYMKENPNISTEETRQHMFNIISNEWKTLNKESLIPPNPFPPTFINITLNIVRMIPLLYSYDENQSLPGLEKLLKSMLYDKLVL